MITKIPESMTGSRFQLRPSGPKALISKGLGVRKLIEWIPRVEPDI